VLAERTSKSPLPAPHPAAAPMGIVGFRKLLDRREGCDAKISMMEYISILSGSRMYLVAMLDLIDSACMQKLSWCRLSKFHISLYSCCLFSARPIRGFLPYFLLPEYQSSFMA
jgi:hypothetical protein